MWRPTDRLPDLTDGALARLLGREGAPKAPAAMLERLAGRTVLVTGAGGSIGSELCRQILAASPKAIVMVDAGEAALFYIDEELRQRCKAEGLDVALIPLLGSITDAERLDAIFGRFAVDMVFHAAAYKHVPLVELNFSEAIRNNVIGTETVIRCCIRHRVKSFVLLSTDKAAEPVSIMGTSKRLAELLVAAHAATADCVMSVVRFGNVFASSGSLVPVILRQIGRGGPVTVTSPAATRFFMTTAEAAQLVIAVAGLGSRGGLFVFEMGEPVSIDTLVRRLIAASGLTVRDEHRPDGDIELIYTGLRPGERLEEVAIPRASLRATPHPKIHEVRQPPTAAIPPDELVRVATAAARESTSARAMALMQAVIAEAELAGTPARAKAEAAVRVA
ncbi:MAG: polysaccharide biosynthesis protein [Bauldia sp.]|nr:polysaccharide biosynthesis protein [Bauldia sp.]